jgi:sigma-B regulation protein RsbU (phosphoserine phosphatase)
LTYANAGHPEGIILDRRGNIKSRMASTQIPLAILPGTEYDVSEAIPLLPGDTILLRSDGLQETVDREGKYYGTKRILREVRANSTRTAREIVNHLYACAKSHGSPNKLVDDITLLAVKVTA